MAKKYLYIIDLNERDYFNAHVEEEKTGKLVFDFSNETMDEEGNTSFNEISMIEDGFMKHIKDTDSLQDYLVEMKVIPEDSTIKFVG